MLDRLYQKAPLGVLSVFLVTGTWVGIQFVTCWIPILFLFIISSLLFVSRFNHLDTYFSAIIFFSLGWYLASNEQTNISHLLQASQEIHLEKVTFSGVIQEVKPTEKGWKAKVYLKKLKSEHQDNPIKNPYVFVYGRSPKHVTVSSHISGTGTFRIFKGKRNPGDFNFQSFYLRKGVIGKIFIKKGETPTLIINHHFSLLKFITAIRHKISHIIFSFTDTETAGILTALILGEKSFVDEDLRQSFAKTGVIHVLAVSGLHVGYVLLVLSLITTFLRIPWGWNRVFIIFGLILFCLITGLKPSVMRASLMAALFLLSPVLNRSSNSWNIIGVASVLLLIVNPLSILDLGFLLSFSAVISIIYFYNYFETHLPNWINPTHYSHPVPKFIIGLFFVSISAQIGTLPITAFTFGQIPIISSIANIFIVPLIGILVAIGFSILGFYWIPYLGDWLGESAWSVQWVIKNIAHFFASIPFATIQVSSIDLSDISIYILLTTTILILFHQAYRKYAIITFILTLNIIVWRSAIRPMNTTDIIFLDVGQGDAALIRFPNDQTMLIDAGYRSRREDMGERVVVPVLNHFGMDKINWLVMSHPHSDHIGGIESIVQQVKVDTVLDTYIDYHSWTYKNLLTLFDKNKITRVIPESGDIQYISPNIKLYFFSPDSIYASSQSNVNNASIVFSLTIQDISILFTGDLEMEGDHVISQFGSLLTSDILKVAHHGSITSTTSELLNKIHPKYAVVSVGEGNKFRHPSSIVMDRLKSYNIQINRTDQSGAIWFKTDGKSLWIHPWK